MLRSLVLAASLLAVPQLEAPAPLVRVDQGEARLAEGRAVRVLERRTGTVALAGECGWLEVSARSAVELSWRGLASATLEGPAMFRLTRVPGLELEHAQVLELEVRRGTFAFELAGVGSFELGAGALQVRTLPGGVFELLNRGGGALALERAGERALKVAPGQRLRLPPRAKA